MVVFRNGRWCIGPSPTVLLAAVKCLQCGRVALFNE